MADPDKDPEVESLSEDELEAVAGGMGAGDGPPEGIPGEAGVGEAI